MAPKMAPIWDAWGKRKLVLGPTCVVDSLRPCRGIAGSSVNTATQCRVEGVSTGDAGGRSAGQTGDFSKEWLHVVGSVEPGGVLIRPLRDIPVSLRVALRLSGVVSVVGRSDGICSRGPSRGHDCFRPAVLHSIIVRGAVGDASLQASRSSLAPGQRCLGCDPVPCGSRDTPDRTHFRLPTPGTAAGLTGWAWDVGNAP